MQTTWSARLDATIPPLDEQEIRELGKEQCGFFSKAGHVLKRIFTLSKPDLDQHYLAEGKALLRSKNIEFIQGYSDVVSPEIAEIVRERFESSPPNNHKLTRDEMQLGEAFCAHEELMKTRNGREWLTLELLENIEVTNESAPLIFRLKNLDDLQQAARGEKRRFEIVFAAVMGERSAVEVTDGDTQQIRALLQTWTSLKLTPDKESFETVLKLVRQMSGKKELTRKNCDILQGLLKITSQQMVRVNSDKLLKQDLPLFLGSYLQHKPLPEWDAEDLQRIDRFMTIWFTNMPNEGFYEMSSFFEAGPVLCGREELTTPLCEFTEEMLEHAEAFTSLTRYVHFQKKTFKGDELYSGVCRLLGKENLKGVSLEEINALKERLQIHQENPEVGFKEFGKLYEKLEGEEKQQLTLVVKGFTAYKKLIQQVPDRTVSIDEYLQLARIVAMRSGWSAVAEQFSLDEPAAQEVPPPQQGYVAMLQNFARKAKEFFAEDAPLQMTPEQKDLYLKQLRRALNTQSDDAFILMSKILPKTPAVIELLDTKKLDISDTRVLLRNIELLLEELSDTNPAEVRKGISGAAKDFSSEHLEDFAAFKGRVLVHLQKMEPDAKRRRALTPKDQKAIAEAQKEMLKQGILTSDELHRLTLDYIDSENEITVVALKLFYQERASLKVLQSEYPPLFCQLMIDELCASDQKVVNGYKPLKDNTLYKQPIEVQALQCAQRLIAELNHTKSNSKLPHSVVEQVMRDDPPATAEETEKKLAGLLMLQQCYADALHKAGNGPLAPYMQALISTVGARVIDEEFVQREHDPAAVTYMLERAAQQLMHIQQEASVAENFLAEAAAHYTPEEGWGIILSDETQLNKLMAFGTEVGKPEGRMQFHQLLQERYVAHTCAKIMMGEYGSDEDKEAFALLGRELNAVFPGDGQPLTQEKQAHIYNICKIALSFIHDNHSPREVIKHIQSFDELNEEMSEKMLIQLTNHIQEQLTKAPPTKPWNNFQNRLIGEPELIVAKLFPALLEAMGKDLDPKRVAHAKKQLEEAGEIIKHMPVKSKLALLEPMTDEMKRANKSSQFIMNLLLALVTTDRSRLGQRYELLREAIFDNVGQHVDDAKTLLQDGKYHTDFPFETMIEGVLNGVEQARMKRELLEIDGVDEEMVVMNGMEQFFVKACPHLADSRKLAIAKFAVGHFPQIFGLGSKATKATTKYLLGYLIDYTLAGGALEGVGEKEQLQALLSPVIELLADGAPILGKRHQLERYMGLIQVINKAVQSNEEDFNRMEVKKALLDAIGGLVCEIGEYGEELEVVLDAVADIASEEVA